MKRVALRRRFWIECGAFAVAAFLAVLTFVVPDWIEVVFGVDPDAHSGELELVVALGAAAVALGVGLVAGAEWRRAVRPKTLSTEP